MADTLRPEIPLETFVVVTDREEDAYCEIGVVRNSWPATFFPWRRVYSVETGSGFGVYHETQIAECRCPDCDDPWGSFNRPCPGCGLTIEKITERMVQEGRL